METDTGGRPRRGLVRVTDDDGEAGTEGDFDTRLLPGFGPRFLYAARGESMHESESPNRAQRPHGRSLSHFLQAFRQCTQARGF